MAHFDRRDLAAGALLILIGGAFLAGSLDLRIGTARSMGAGYFPLTVSIITIALGLLILAMALRRAGTLTLPPWRPFAAVIASVAVFAISIRWLGLIPAIFATVAVAAIADRRSTVVGAIVLAILLTAGSWLIFVASLGMSIPILEWPR